MRNHSKIIIVLGIAVLSGCGGGRSNGGLPPGQVQHATGVNPASGQVHTPTPSIGVKLR